MLTNDKVNLSPIQQQNQYNYHHNLLRTLTSPNPQHISQFLNIFKAPNSDIISDNQIGTQNRTTHLNFKKDFIQADKFIQGSPIISINPFSFNPLHKPIARLSNTTSLCNSIDKEKLFLSVENKMPQSWLLSDKKTSEINQKSITMSTMSSNSILPSQQQQQVRQFLLQKNQEILSELMETSQNQDSFSNCSPQDFNTSQDDEQNDEKLAVKALTNLKKQMSERAKIMKSSPSSSLNSESQGGEEMKQFNQLIEQQFQDIFNSKQRLNLFPHHRTNNNYQLKILQLRDQIQKVESQIIQEEQQKDEILLKIEQIEKICKTNSNQSSNGWIEQSQDISNINQSSNNCTNNDGKENTQDKLNDNLYKLVRRNRRPAMQIQRLFKCPVANCNKTYGSDGSLNQHIKLKHPGIQYVSKRQAALKQQTEALAGADAILSKHVEDSPQSIDRIHDSEKNEDQELVQPIQPQKDYEKINAVNQIYSQIEAIEEQAGNKSLE
ncbi:zinc c2h2 type family [Stylonychia lemnae]|uniref:Zinc c2h2 type family n=1 Tax=Stylonychia lemnae TaxID=5949 RepID=A0A077ZX52_STYLE|nr:zinc c2h2 type family [Stylonychia lemnae]|eukprot:CDW73101.1 zinc c2h2 type family [Stylonychia lemnae]